MKILSLIQKCSFFIRTYGFAKGLRVIYWGILNRLPQFIGRPILFRRLGKVENSIYKIIGDKIASFQEEDDQRVYNHQQTWDLEAKQNEPCSPKEFHRILNSDTMLFKLSYKNPLVEEVNGEPTLYGRIKMKFG